jgi:hypothetical protein
VTSPLPGAEVVVNGKRVGATPLPASVAVPPGKASVELQRAGYRTAAQTIALDEGAHGELTLTLEEDPAAPESLRGRLLVTSSEPGSELVIDGGARRALAGAVSLPIGPHHVRVEKLGYEPTERNVEVVNGQDASLQITLAPTAETQARLDSSRATRKVAAWSLLAGGAALVAAGVIVGVVENGALSSARTDFTHNVTDKENDLTNVCYKDEDIGLYDAHMCDKVHSYYQNRVDKASLGRLLGFVGAGVGVVAAGVGGYLLATTGGHGDAAVARAGVTGVAAWTGPGTGGLVLSGRF